MKAFAVLLFVLLVAACGGSNSPTATLPPASATSSASPAASATTSFPPTVAASPTTAPAATETPNPGPTSTVIVSPPPPVPSPGGDTGVAGVVLLGPTCPVQRIDSPCPDKPWQGIVIGAHNCGRGGRAGVDRRERRLLAAPAARRLRHRDPDLGDSAGACDAARDRSSRRGRAGAAHARHGDSIGALAAGATCRCGVPASPRRGRERVLCPASGP